MFSLGMDLWSNLDISGGSLPIVPLFERIYTSTPSLGANATFTRASSATVADHEGVIRTVPSGCARFEGGRFVRNLFTNTTTSLASGSATTAVSVGVGTYIFSMGAGSGTATFSGTATGSSGTLDADGSSRTAITLTITVAGTIVVTASVADLATIQLENATGRADTTTPSEYVSVGVPTGPEVVTNGTFVSDITGWGDLGAWTAGSAVWSASGIVVTVSGYQGAAQQLTGLIPGKDYIVTLTDVVADGTAISGRVYVGHEYNPGSSPILSTYGTTGTKGYLFKATATTHSIGLSSQSGSGDVTWGSVSVKNADLGAGVDGVKYFATENGNSVASNVVTEGTGAAISGIALLMEPAATNYADNTETFGL